MHSFHNATVLLRKELIYFTTVFKTPFQSHVAFAETDGTSTTTADSLLSLLCRQLIRLVYF